jgi:molecular chaperone HtpG
MIEALETEAEQLAEQAEKLATFGGLSLLHVKRQVADLLGLIGRGGIFDQYTKHDIAHIDEMLRSLHWLIPEATKAIMTPADWLMIVLAIYFHDLGMLVTESEYETRASTGFAEFLDRELFAGEEGKDYRAKVEQRYPDSVQAERFLYQEFVRYKHAERIAAWISGKVVETLGDAHSAVREIERLLGELSSRFRRDLAMVCESHHLSDINNFAKYKVSQPYGNSLDETVNLHYAAVMLRTADLLDITRNRTPPILFRIISPTDPISQEEWAKHSAVTAVRPKVGLNEDNLPDEAAPRDTIEVFADFEDENGYFGLTSYLKYAEDELRRSFESIRLTKSITGSRFDFPWRRIDDSNVETVGFLRRPFGFTIDQTKILDLLTGHTLYNDTNVVCVKWSKTR